MENSQEELLEVKWFECKACNMREIYDSKEKKPKFLHNITFTEGCYVVKDPFTQSENCQFFVLGSDCCICNNPVCQANECSIFYKKRYCQECAQKNKEIFPQQLLLKIKENKI